MSICIGTNDCARNTVDGKSLIESMKSLIDTTKKIFPLAAISILAIPPQRNSKVTRYIRGINLALKKVALDNNILFKPCSSLWNHVSSDGTVDDGILIDQVHLTAFGLSLMLQNVIPFFYGPSRNRSSESDTRLNQSSETLLGDIPSYNASPKFSKVETSNEKHPSFYKQKQHQLKSQLPQMVSKVKNVCAVLWKRYIEN